MLTLNVFSSSWHWIANHLFWSILIVIFIVFIIRWIINSGTTIRMGRMRLTWPAWLRWNPNFGWWVLGICCLIAVFIIFRHYQDNRRYIKALNKKEDLAKIEMRKMEVIAQIPAKRFEQVEEVKTIYKKEPASKYKPGTVIQKTVACGQVVSIETDGQTYDLDGVSGNALCLQVSSNGITWNKVPHRFPRSPQKLFVKNTGTGDVTFKATFR